MSNIMITYRCNLCCPYCFANEFVNKSYTDMTMEQFEKALDFLTREGPGVIGLIGGEPTLHPLFPDFIKKMSKHPNVRGIMLYTNGLLLDRHAKLLSDPTISPLIRILVNCNSPEEMGAENFQKLKDNLDLLIGKYHMYEHIKFGVNLHNNEFDYSFMKELLMRYSQYQVRMSLTVPAFSECGQVDVLAHFQDRKQYLLDFYHAMDEIGVLAYFDCNRPPSCVWTDEEWQWICWYRNKYSHFSSNISDPVTVCSPVIDILPNLKAVRCFGMSEMEKTNIEDFACVSDLKAYYDNLMDSQAYRIPSHEDCRDCYSRKVKKCTGGCVGFKMSNM